MIYWTWECQLAGHARACNFDIDSPVQHPPFSTGTNGSSPFWSGPQMDGSYAESAAS